jgi:hypothetical protein
MRWRKQIGLSSEPSLTRQAKVCQTKKPPAQSGGFFMGVLVISAPH